MRKRFSVVLYLLPKFDTFKDCLSIILFVVFCTVCDVILERNLFTHRAVIKVWAQGFSWLLKAWLILCTYCHVSLAYMHSNKNPAIGKLLFWKSADLSFSVANFKRWNGMFFTLELQTFKSFYFSQGSTKCGPSITWHRNENFAELWGKDMKKLFWNWKGHFFKQRKYAQNVLNVRYIHSNWL